MQNGSTAGFTIIELILFLALSGLFLLIAFAGIGTRSGQIQFTDSMRSLNSYLQRQYSDTINGVNPRDGSIDCLYSGASANLSGSSSPGESQCTIMGKVIVFSDNASMVSTYLIVGRFLTQTVPTTDVNNYLDPSRSDLQLIQQANPTVLTTRLNETYNVEWQSKFIRSGSSQTAIAFIRSPRSSNIYPITFTPSWSGSNPPLGVTSLVPNANYCFLGLNGQDAQLNVGGTNFADAISLKFDTGCS